MFPNNEGGMRAAVLHLIDHGHRRIAFVGDRSNHDIEQRYQGYQAALAERDIAFDPALIFALAGTGEENGAGVVRRLRDAERSCRAVVCATDETALGVLSAAQAAGYRVPEDLAIVGFDDTILAHGATPLLTVVDLLVYPVETINRAPSSSQAASVSRRSVHNRLRC